VNAKAFGDFDLNASFEAGVSFLPPGGGVRVAVHDDDGGIVSCGEFSERVAEGDAVAHANGRIGDGTCGGLEDEAIANAVKIAAGDDVRSGKSDLNDARGGTGIALVDAEVSAGVNGRAGVRDEEVLESILKFVHDEAGEVSTRGQSSDVVFQNDGSGNGRVDGSI
jgi:hypothetical protein